MKKLVDWMKGSMIGKSIVFLFQSLLFTFKPEFKKSADALGKQVVDLSSKNTSEIIKFLLVVFTVGTAVLAYFGKVDVSMIEGQKEALEAVKTLAPDSLPKDSIVLDSL